MLFKKNMMFKNFSWNLLSNVIYSFSQWIIIVIITKFGDDKMLGQYSLAFSITAPIVLLCGLSLRAYQITDVKNSFSTKNYMDTRKLTNYLSLIIIIIIILFSNYSIETDLIIILIGINKLIDGLSDIVQGDYQLNDNLEMASKLKILKSCVLIVSTVVSFLFFENFVNIIVSMTVINFIYYYFIDYRLIQVKIKSKKIEKIKIKSIIIITWTMGLNISLSSLTTNIPRIFIEKYDGLEKLGYFTAISYFMLIGTLFVTALGQATSTTLSRNLENGNVLSFKRTIKRNIIVSLFLGIVSIIISIFFGKEIIKIFYGDTFSDYNKLLIILMIASSFNFITSPYSYGIISLRIMNKQPLITLISLILSLVLSMLLIPFYGIYGAGYVVVISSIQQFFMKRYIYLKALKAIE